MHKKMLSFLLMISLVLIFITGCGGKNSETASDAAQVENAEGELPSGNITLRVWGAEEDEELIKQIIISFIAQYSGQASFNISFEPHSEASCKDDLLGDVLNAPDVFTFADDQLLSFAASGVLKKVENDSEISGRNLPAASSAASVGGKLYAYPLTADNGYFLFYNKKYVNEEDARTMDGLLAAADACGKKVFMDMSSGWYMYSFFGNTDMEIGLNDDGISTFCNWNAKYTDITGSDVAEAMARIGSNPVFTAVSNDGFAAGAADGTFVAGVSGIWDENAIKEAWGDDYEAVKLPTYTVAGQQLQMASYAGYKLVGVNSYSENAAWAAKFADWMTNEQNQTLRFTMRGQGPSNKNVSASGDVAQSKAVKALQQQADFSSLQRVGGTYWNAATTFGAIMSEGNPEGKDLQVLLNEMVTGITGEESTGDAPGQEDGKASEENSSEEDILEENALSDNVSEENNEVSGEAADEVLEEKKDKKKISGAVSKETADKVLDNQKNERKNSSEVNKQASDESLDKQEDEKGNSAEETVKKQPKDTKQDEKTRQAENKERDEKTKQAEYKEQKEVTESRKAEILEGQEGKSENNSSEDVVGQKKRSWRDAYKAIVGQKKEPKDKAVEDKVEEQPLEDKKKGSLSSTVDSIGEEVETNTDESNDEQLNDPENDSEEETEDLKEDKEKKIFFGLG